MTLETAETVTAPMLNKAMFAVFARLMPGRSLAELLLDHLRYMIGLEESGHLFAAGPLVDETGTPTGDGLILLRADTLAEARDLVSRDPFVVAGVRSVEVQPWRIMEGRVSLAVNFARGTFSFD